MFRESPFTQIFTALACTILFCSCKAAPEWYSKDVTYPELPAEIFFNKDAGHGDSLFITVRSESGEDWMFGVDTGSPITTMDKSLESKLGKRLSTKQISFGWMGDYSVGVYQPPKIYIGKIPLVIGDNVESADLSQFSKTHRMMGILAMDCLHHYCIQLDFATHKIRFLNPDAHEANLGKAFPLKISRAGVTVRASFINTNEVKSGIDSAEYLDGSLKPDQFQLALKEHSQALARQWTNESGNIFMVQFSSASFAGETYTNVVVREHSNGEDTIGLHLLSRYLVTLNFPRQTMYLQSRL